MLPTTIQNQHPGAGPRAPPHPQGRLPRPWQPPHWVDERVSSLRAQLRLCGSGTQQVNGRLWKPPTTANDQPQGDFFPPLGSGVNCQPCF